jgi:CRISPR/Cas system-associated endonuclease/helicase Cas3
MRLCTENERPSTIKKRIHKDWIWYHATLKIQNALHTIDSSKSMFLTPFLVMTLKIHITKPEKMNFSSEQAHT